MVFRVPSNPSCSMSLGFPPCCSTTAWLSQQQAVVSSHLLVVLGGHTVKPLDLPHPDNAVIFRDRYSPNIFSTGRCTDPGGMVLICARLRAVRFGRYSFGHHRSTRALGKELPGTGRELREEAGPVPGLAAPQQLEQHLGAPRGQGVTSSWRVQLVWVTALTSFPSSRLPRRALPGHLAQAWLVSRQHLSCAAPGHHPSLSGCVIFPLWSHSGLPEGSQRTSRADGAASRPSRYTCPNRRLQQ